MIKTKDIETTKICCKKITVTYNDENMVIEEVVFEGGCPGNVIGIANLVKGMTVEEASKRLLGINCSERGTSCPDQLAKGLIALTED